MVTPKTIPAPLVHCSTIFDQKTTAKEDDQDLQDAACTVTIFGNRFCKLSQVGNFPKAITFLGMRTFQIALNQEQEDKLASAKNDIQEKNRKGSNVQNPTSSSYSSRLKPCRRSSKWQYSFSLLSLRFLKRCRGRRRNTR